VDVNLSSDDDTITAPKPDVPASQKASTGNDPISSGAPKQSDPSIADQVLTIILPTGGHGRKCPPTDQVMTQFVLPPYHGPRSPLDLVAIKIIFGCIFEAF
jgi:hypothetical protein